MEGARIHSRGKEERATGLRSTGLGKTELLANDDDLRRHGTHLILHVKTTEPVRWHVRAAISYSVMLAMIRLRLNPKVLWYIATGFFSAKALENRLNVKAITLRVASPVAKDIGAALIATEKS